MSRAVSTAVAQLLSLLILLPAPIPCTPGVDLQWQWGMLWRNNVIQQVIGYAMPD
jgi:hypothetical protein